MVGVRREPLVALRSTLFRGLTRLSRGGRLGDRVVISRTGQLRHDGGRRHNRELWFTSCLRATRTAPDRRLALRAPRQQTRARVRRPARATNLDRQLLQLHGRQDTLARSRTDVLSEERPVHVSLVGLDHRVLPLLVGHVGTTIHPSETGQTRMRELASPAKLPRGWRRDNKRSSGSSTWLIAP